MTGSSNSKLNQELGSTFTTHHQDYAVRQIGISEYLPAAKSLAEAFKNDAVAGYIVGTNGSEQCLTGEAYKLNHDILKYVTAAHCYKGLVTTIGPNYDAVALWIPPGKSIDGWWTIIQSGLWRLLYKLHKEARIRSTKEFIPLLHDTMEMVLGDRSKKCYYLVYLGTRPGSERKGYGRKLLEHVTAMADAEGVPCYLESSAARNIPFYEKSGFKLVKDIFLQRGEQPVQLNIMVREPQIKGSDKPVLSESSSNSSSVKCEKVL